ncbi:MAG: carotenoid oxygenase family protein [Rhizobiaceae bacterium]|nr:carotenoid oxygenase family protein [Rhizobiaceae bacterium]
MFHFANGFERGCQIVVDYVRHQSLRIAGGPRSTTPPLFHRMEIDLAKRSIADAPVSSLTVEFPRINDAFEALPSRFSYLPTLTASLRLESPPSATYNSLLKINSESGAVGIHDFGNRIIGEAVFIPSGHGERENDGYLATFVYDIAGNTSDLVLLDARHVDADPIAVVRLPRRIPQGLHGSWIPGNF